ncbi:unnamed protein product [Psylliodes chrysocephalus]|uniref:Mutator-like transposase domain-containing protein n=1 Tax=Psylliodes chrysocephalus TaxID=3402493 RepID=A0A9P0CH24_9CUCU|nr:unnamed protein product [Psylliodes chrysocephala]
MQKLKYVKMIGDGASSVYQKNCLERFYGRTMVSKVECINHLLRNYCTNTKKYSPKNKIVSPRLKKVLSDRILKLRVGIKSAVNYHRKITSDIVDNVKQLTADIKTSPYHTFGNHSNCAQYFCKRQQNDRDYVTEIEECGLTDDIVSAVNGWFITDTVYY